MRRQDFDRRRFLGLAAGGAVAATAFPALTAPTRRQVYASCGADDSGGFFVATFDGDGRILFRTPISGRGHDLALHPERAELVAFARRPGSALHVVDTGSGRLTHRIDVPPDRRYYGHGVFAADGRALFVTENDFAAGRGVIGVYDPADRYRRIDELPSHGVGPHQLELMPGGETLAIANGGIRTHPDTGRIKLNIEEMTPSLTFVDAASGRLEERRTPPARLHKLSIRHVDVNPAGTVAVAMAYEGDRRDEVPLVALARPGGPLRLLEPDPLHRRMRHYTGAISFDSSGAVIAVSAPRGNVIGLWDAATGKMAGRIASYDSSGIAPAGPAGRFLVTGGDGAIRIGGAGERPPTVLRPATHGIRWDNHVAPVPV